MLRWCRELILSVVRQKSCLDQTRYRFHNACCQNGIALKDFSPTHTSVSLHPTFSSTVCRNIRYSFLYYFFGRKRGRLLRRDGMELFGPTIADHRSEIPGKGKESCSIISVRFENSPLYRMISSHGFSKKPRARTERTWPFSNAYWSLILPLSTRPLWYVF